MTTLTIVGWNINSDRRVDSGVGPNRYTTGAFPNMSLKARYEYIQTCIEEMERQGTTVFALQELGTWMVDDFRSLFEKKGYTVHIDPYTDHPGAFRFLFAYSPERIEVESKQQVYFTRSGGPTYNRDELKKEGMNVLKYENMGEEWEKSAQFFVLLDKESGIKFNFVNNHFGLSEEHRIQAAETVTCALQNSQIPSILVGDFNQFDSKKAGEADLLREQIAVFQNKGFSWVTEGLNEHESESKTTFICFPYDIHRLLKQEDFDELNQIKSREPEDYCGIRDFYINKIDEKKIDLTYVGEKGISNCLDAVFSNMPKDFGHVSAKSLLFLNHKLVEKPISRKDLNTAVTDAYREGECPLPSDHLPLVVDVNFTETSDKKGSNICRKK